ncbi:COMM domain containing 4 [Turdus rufiventris]|nr:COMM domain containing 4 [Turdus rufiventris]
MTRMSSTATGVIPELGQMLVMEESRTAPVGPVPTPAGPPGPTRASPGSVPHPCSTNPTLECGSEPGHHAATSSSVTSPSCLPTSPGAGHAASSLLSSQSLAVPTGVILDAHIMSSSSSTSQHSSAAMEHLPAATREAFSPAELMKGHTGSTGTKPPVSHPFSLPFPTQPVHVLPLQFCLLGITYTPALGSRNSESYQQLERDVRLLLSQMLSSYESFLQANVLKFMNGSVVVRGEVLFRGDAPAPTNSHLIRTVITEASKGRSIFSWQLDPQSVQSGGFSLQNLDPEKLSISLTGSQLGMSRMDPLEKLVSEITSSVSALYNVRNFTISQIRSLTGSTKITGDLYLDTVVHADVMDVLEALTSLSDLSMDLASVSVEGSKLGLYVYPLSLLVTNRHFSHKLQDPLSEEHHNLSMDLGDAVARVLSDYPSFLKVIIKEFLPGSVICHGNMIFRHPAPSSMEVLKKLVLSVGPNQALGDSDIHVDLHSLAVGEDTLDPPLHQPGFPAYGVAFMVIGGLCIIAAPIVLVCLGTKRLGWQQGRALWDRRDPEVGIQTLEMDNQGYWTERFRFCGDLDCPDWVLAEISTLAKISSVKLKLICAQVLRDLLGEAIEYDKILKLTSDAKLESGDVKATIAVLGFILSSAAKHNVDSESLSSELQQLGLPKVSQLGSVRWRVDYTLSSSELQEVNEPVVHLTFNVRDRERDTMTAVPVTLSASKFWVLLAELKQAQTLMNTLL